MTRNELCRIINSGDFPSYQRERTLEDILARISANTNPSPITVRLAEPAAPAVPTRAIFNGPATILLWPDGTKTVVKCQDGEPFDAEKGVAMTILKKLYGGGKYNDVLRDLIKSATGDERSVS